MRLLVSSPQNTNKLIKIMFLLRTQTFLFLAWIFLAFPNFGIIREAVGTGCTPSSGNTFQASVYLSNLCQQSVAQNSSSDKNCFLIGTNYIKSNCAAGTYQVFYDSSCSNLQNNYCMHICSSLSQTSFINGGCSFVK